MIGRLSVAMLIIFLSLTLNYCIGLVDMMSCSMCQVWVKAMGALQHELMGAMPCKAAIEHHALRHRLGLLCLCCAAYRLVLYEAALRTLVS